MNLSGSLGTGSGEFFFSPIGRLGDGSYYDGPVLVMCIDRDIRINGLVAWAASYGQSPISGVVLLSTPETEPYSLSLEQIIKEALTPLKISFTKIGVPGAYDSDKARYNFLLDLFSNYLSHVREKIIVDLTASNNPITEQLHAVASEVSIGKFQKIELYQELISVPPYDRLQEGVDYAIRELPKYSQKNMPSEKSTPHKSNSSISVKRISILFLAADPTDASRLRLGEEFREIKDQLRLSKWRDQFELELPQLSLRSTDITQALLDTQPQIVHFSGHGTSAGELCFETQSGLMQLVKPDSLAALFEEFDDMVNCVLLNACYSEAQAKAIAEHIEYVIGMNQKIGDKAAIAFAIGFYQALGAGRTIEQAYRLGCAQIRLQGIEEQLTPVLIKRE